VYVELVSCPRKCVYLALGEHLTLLGNLAVGVSMLGFSISGKSE
jgi:hypothetical protein